VICFRGRIETKSGFARILDATRGAEPMRLHAPILLFAAALAGCASSHQQARAPAATPAPIPTIGGVAIDPAATIAANVARAPVLATFVKAVRAAELDQTLADPGPITLFAPTNDAFGRLAPGTVDALLKPENKPSLVKLLDYWIVGGRVTTADLRDRIQAGGGSATLATTEGDPLTVTLTGAVLTLTDVNGNRSYIQAGDVSQANGLIHVVNGVLIPDLG
jgi:uncharacterized surface protein with fasciclin (FAS1) repeats